MSSKIFAFFALLLMACTPEVSNFDILVHITSLTSATEVLQVTANLDGRVAPTSEYKRSDYVQFDTVGIEFPIADLKQGPGLLHLTFAGLTKARVIVLTLQQTLSLNPQKPFVEISIP